MNIMADKIHQHTIISGFTLVELIVSIAVFTIVITISVGSLLVLISANENLQAEQSVMTNLSFALDSMTREIRTGTHYYCASASGLTGIFTNSTNLDVELLNGTDQKTQDCHDGNISARPVQGVAFLESGNSITSGAGVNRILYFYNADEEKIYRRIGTEEAQPITSSGIKITDAEFFVSGSKSLRSAPTTQNDQAAVTIFLEAVDVLDPGVKYHIQTTVTQRMLDL